jgi:hypothetical protein
METLNKADRKATGEADRKATRKASGEAKCKAKRETIREASREATDYKLDQTFLYSSDLSISKTTRKAKRETARKSAREAAYYKQEHMFLYLRVLSDLRTWGKLQIAEDIKKKSLVHYQSFQLKVLKGLEAKMVELLGKDIVGFLFSFLSPFWKQKTNQNLDIDFGIPSRLTCLCHCEQISIAETIFCYSHFHSLACDGNCHCRFSRDCGCLYALDSNALDSTPEFSSEEEYDDYDSYGSKNE